MSWNETDHYVATDYKTEKAWLEARDSGIGASEAAAVLGESPWSGPFEIYCRKLGLTDGWTPSEAAEWGHRLEPAIARKYEDETGRTVIDPGNYTIYRSKSDPHLLATLDRLITGQDRRPIARGTGLLELKTTGGAYGDDWAEGPPQHYWIQVQHQLAVTGLGWGSIAVLIGGQKFLWADIDRDDAFIDTVLRPACRDLWRRIEGHDQPPPDEVAPDRTRKILHAMYAKDAGETVALGGETVDMDIELQEIKNDIRKLNARKTHLENSFKAAMGNAVSAVLPNGVTYTWRTQEKAGYEVKPSSMRVLRRLKPKS